LWRFWLGVEGEMNETVLICSKCTYPFVALDPNAYDVAEPVCGMCQGSARLMVNELAALIGFRPRLVEAENNKEN
jgi:hypothetical protein